MSKSFIGRRGSTSSLASSMASSVQSQQVAAAITGEETILLILNDEDFEKKAKGGFLNKNKGAVQSEVLRGKISRKLGPTNAISITEAATSKWVTCLTPAPRPNMIYRQHPFNEDQFIGLDMFHSTLIEEMRYNRQNYLHSWVVIHIILI